MPRVAVDALGGDKAPDEVILGALDAAADGIEIVLYGPAGLDTRGLALVETTEVIEMADKPAEAVRAKPDSSLVAAVRGVAAGYADAVVSAGNTGAMLAAGLIHLRRLPGVMRPAIAVPIPARDGPSVLIDAGANADARPEHLLQFAYMGSVFSRELLGVESPKVRLLSIGEEDEKGNALVLETHELLRDSELNFAGNVESRDLLRGAGDVVVTDGFTGNVTLKFLEGTIKDLLEELRQGDHRHRHGQARRPLSGPRPAASDAAGSRYLRRCVPARPAGAAVIAHGNSGRRAMANAIRWPLVASIMAWLTDSRSAPGTRPCMIARFSSSPYPTSMR